MQFVSADFTDYNEIVPDHIEPKGMGGAWRDDHPDNIQAVHRRCNLQKGSRRLRSGEALMTRSPVRGLIMAWS